MTLTIHTYARYHRKQGQLIPTDELDRGCMDIHQYVTKQHAIEDCIKGLRGLEGQLDGESEFKRTQFRSIREYALKHKESGE